MLVDVAEDTAVVAFVGVLAGLAVGRHRRAARAVRAPGSSSGPRLLGSPPSSMYAIRRMIPIPPPPTASPPAPRMPRRSVTWPVEPGVRVECHGVPRTGSEATSYEPAHVGLSAPPRFDLTTALRARVRQGRRAPSDICPCGLMTDGGPRCSPGPPYRVDIANGPPDTETLDRRRVDPPAGCRAAAGRQSCLSGGPSTISTALDRPLASADGRSFTNGPNSGSHPEVARHVVGPALPSWFPPIRNRVPYATRSDGSGGRPGLTVRARGGDVSGASRAFAERVGAVELMPHYIHYFSHAKSAWRGMGEHPEDREEAARKVIDVPGVACWPSTGWPVTRSRSPVSGGRAPSRTSCAIRAPSLDHRPPTRRCSTVGGAPPVASDWTSAFTRKRAVPSNPACHDELPGLARAPCRRCWRHRVERCRVAPIRADDDDYFVGHPPGPCPGADGEHDLRSIRRPRIHAMLRMSNSTRRRPWSRVRSRPRVPGPPRDSSPA